VKAQRRGQLPRICGYRISYGLAAQRRQDHSSRRLGPQHGPNSRHDPRRRYHARTNRSEQTVGWHGASPAQRQNRTSSPRRARNRPVHRSRQGPYAMGRTPGIQWGSRTGRLHLCSALRAAPGDQCSSRRTRPAPSARAIAARSMAMFSAYRTRTLSRGGCVVFIENQTQRLESERRASRAPATAGA
jgi:hypothetical protein